jgi:hypothetical protein
MTRKKILMCSIGATASLIIASTTFSKKPFWLKRKSPTQTQYAYQQDLTTSELPQTRKRPRNQLPNHLIHFRDACISKTKSSVDLSKQLEFTKITKNQASALIDDIGIERTTEYLADLGPDAYSDSSDLLYLTLIERLIDADSLKCISTMRILNPNRIPDESFSFLLAKALNEPDGKLREKIAEDLFPISSWATRAHPRLIEYLLESGNSVSSIIVLLKSIPDDNSLADFVINRYYGNENRKLDLQTKDGQEILNFLKQSKSIYKTSLIEKLTKESEEIHQDFELPAE